MMVNSIDKKMINSVRTSRRTMFGGIILCVFSVIALMVVKDMNDKLTVMTSSNSGYQKMTDSQANRINQLNAELKNSKKEYSNDIESFHKTQNELKSKLTKSERQVKQLTPLQDQLSRVQTELQTFKQKHDIEMQQAEEEHTRLLKLLAETRRDKESDQEECRAKLEKLAEERDQCKTPYSNLFKEHQEATDTVQKLQSENKDLQNSKNMLEKQIKLLQNRPSIATIVTPASRSKSVDGRQIQIPNNNKQPQILHPIGGENEATSKRRTSGSNVPLPVAAAPAAMSTAKSVNVNQNYLEEPKLVGRQPIVLNGRGGLRVPGNAPVAAEPPLARHTKGEIVAPVHQNAMIQEDVMEAPKDYKNRKKINYAQINSRFANSQTLASPRKFTLGKSNRIIGANDDLNEEEDNEVDVGPRRDSVRKYSQDANQINALNLNRQIQQPLLLHQRERMHPGFGENLDQQVDNLDQDHPELQRPLDSGRLHDKYLQEEVENQMDDDVDGRLSNRQNFEEENEDKVCQK